MSAKSFADYKPTRGRIPQGCRAPDCTKPTDGIVYVAMRAKQAKGVNGPGQQLASLQMSFCEQHAIEVFERAAAQFPEKP